MKPLHQQSPFAFLQRRSVLFATNMASTGLVPSVEVHGALLHTDDNPPASEITDDEWVTMMEDRAIAHVATVRPSLYKAFNDAAAYAPPDDVSAMRSAIADACYRAPVCAKARRCSISYLNKIVGELTRINDPSRKPLVEAERLCNSVYSRLYL